MESITVLCQRIERWLASHAPSLLSQFQPGASEAELLEVEAALGVTLPEDFKAFYRLHNGGYVLPQWKEGTLTLRDVVSTWEMLRVIREQNEGQRKPFSDEPPGPIQPFHWLPTWIPFLWGGYGGDYVCLDLEPGPGGQVGQIILRLHEQDPARFIAWSFEALLAQGADDLEADKYLSFEGRLEERLTEGKAARDQARRHDYLQPSPGREILEQAFRPGWMISAAFEKKENSILYQQAMEQYNQVLQMEHASPVDHFRAYHNLIILYYNEAERAAQLLSTSQPPNQAAGQQVEDTCRQEAKRLLAAFEAEAAHVPAEHWVHDDLQQDITHIYQDWRVIDYARQAAAEKRISEAFSFLSHTLQQFGTLVFKPWVTTEEQFEIYALLFDLHLGQQQREQARDALAQFAAAAQKRPPEDPIHERVRQLDSKLQQENSGPELFGP